MPKDDSNLSELKAWETAGRVGYLGRSRDRRFREFDRDFRPGRWRLRWEVDGRILDLSEVGRLSEESYLMLLARVPELLDRLTSRARDVYGNAPSNVRSGRDYAVQERKTPHLVDIVLRNVLFRLDREFAGKRLIQVGGRAGEFVELNPGGVPFHRPEWILQPALRGPWMPESVECVWHSNLVVQIQA